jgi:hypothetical protein
MMFVMLRRVLVPGMCVFVCVFVCVCVCVSHQLYTNRCARVTMATLPTRSQIVLLEMEHRCHIDHIDALLKHSMKACMNLHQLMCDTLMEYTKDNVAVLSWI